MDYAAKISKLKRLRSNMKQERIVIDEKSRTLGFDFLERLKDKSDSGFDRSQPFSASIGDTQMCVKCVPQRLEYPTKNHPNMIEYIHLKEFNDNVLFKGISPHITGYYYSKRVNVGCRALRKLKLEKYETDGLIKPKALLIISEFVSGGDMDQFLMDRDEDLSVYEWKVLIFQVIYTLYALQRKYKFMHNDMYFGNVLVDTEETDEEWSCYSALGKRYFTKNVGFSTRLWDFEFSQVYSPPEDMKVHYNNELVNVIDIKPPVVYDEHYDLHFFLSTLLEIEYLHKDVYDWIRGLYPDDTLLEKGKARVSDKQVSNDLTVGQSTSYQESEGSVSGSASVSISGSEEGESSDLDESGSEDGSESGSDGTESDNGFITSSGRLLTGAGKTKNLPTPTSILNNLFFEELTVEPAGARQMKVLSFKS